MVFAFPDCYFNGVSQVDRLVFYRFTKDGEVTQLGELVLYDKQLLSKQILPGIMQQGDEYLVFWGDYQYRLSAEELVLVLKDVKPIIKSSESDGETTSDSAEQRLQTINLLGVLINSRGLGYDGIRKTQEISRCSVIKQKFRILYKKTNNPCVL